MLDIFNLLRGRGLPSLVFGDFVFASIAGKIARANLTRWASITKRKKAVSSGKQYQIKVNDWT